MQCNAMQCNAMQCNAMQCNAMQCNEFNCQLTVQCIHNWIVICCQFLYLCFLWSVYLCICAIVQRTQMWSNTYCVALQCFVWRSIIQTSLSVDGISGFSSKNLAAKIFIQTVIVIAVRIFSPHNDPPIHPHIDHQQHIHHHHHHHHGYHHNCHNFFRILIQ